MRSRMGYSIMLVIVIMLGIGSRMTDEYIPEFVSRHAGDALWASMIYTLFRILLTDRKKYISVVLAALFCLVIESSQLYQASWINQIRATAVGALILGHGFLAVDLVRYAAGIGAAYGLDRFAEILGGESKRC